MKLFKNEENFGVILALISAALHGLGPLIINKGTQNVPPLTFAAITTLIAALFCFIHAFHQKKLHELKIKKTYITLLLITLFIVIIPHILLFIGASKTSGLNTSLLGLSEIIFMLIFTPFIGEKNTPLKYLGALSILIGGIFILYNGQFKINTGDLLIIASTASYPIGNFYAKKAFNILSPSIILFVRFFLGGLVLLSLSIMTEEPPNLANLLTNNWGTILFTGIIFLGLSKSIWYAAFKRLDISKGISLIMTSPLFSIIFLIGIFQEKIYTSQWIGITLMMIGVYFSVKRNSINSEFTKYKTL